MYHTDKKIWGKAQKWELYPFCRIQFVTHGYRILPGTYIIRSLTTLITTSVYSILHAKQWRSCSTSESSISSAKLDSYSQLQLSMCLISSWSTADHQLQLSTCLISSWSTADHQLGLAMCLDSGLSTADISRYSLSQQAERFIARNRTATKVKLSNYWDYNSVYYSNIYVKWFVIA